MRLKLRQLQVFREAARCGSVSAAARALYVSQPSASQSIAAVERHFAAGLFERNARGLALTVAGALVATRIERALDELRDGIAEARRHRGSPSRLDRSISAVQLEALIATVQHGRFGRAARAVHLARPTLHRAARLLEQRIGVALFERTSFGIGPTREAERLAVRAQLAFAELAQARAEVGALTGGAKGRTVIGAMPLARSFLVPTAVLAFAANHPRHSVSILDGTYESLLLALRSGQADVLIGALRGPASTEGIREERLFDDPLALVVRAGHPFARGRAPSVRELPRYEWIAPRAGSPLRRQFSELFEQAGLAVPACPIECSSLVAARAILVDSDRVMLLSAHQVEQDVAAGILVALPHPRGRVTRAIGLTMRSAWRPTAEQLDLLAAVRKVAAEIGARPRGSTRRRSAPTLAPGG